MLRFEPPSVRARGQLVRAIENARHAATLAMQDGARDGKLECGCCGGTIRWSGNGQRSAGSCHGPRCGVRWATQ